MPDNEQRRTSAQGARPAASGFSNRARASFEVEEFEPEAPARAPRPASAAQSRARTTAQPQPRTTTTAQPRATTAQARPATAQTRSANPVQPRQTSAQPRQAATQPRPAQARPASGQTQARAPRPVSRTTAERAQRSATSRASTDWDAAQQAAQKKRSPLMALPEWAKLGIVALVLVALIGAVGRIITTSGTQQDRTVIRPLVSATETPAPGEDAQQVVSNNVETGNENSAPANPVNGSDGATSSPTAEPSDWNSAVATNAPVSIPEGELRRATIRMAGDVIVDWEMLQGCYDKATDRYDFSPYFELIGSTLSSSDYTMINIEASLRKGKYGYSGYPQFTTPPVILQLLRNLGVDMITMCNNHMLDGYCDGIVESVGYVNDARLDHIGGYVDQEDSETPEIYEINGIKVGFVTYTQVTNDMEYKSDDRVNYLVKYLKNAKFKDDIAKARAAGAEVIVAVTHWGEEYKRAPEAATASYAKQLVAAGADIIIGGHPHMVQPAEYITATDANGVSRTALCVYSLGNFLSQHVAKYTDSGIVFEFTIQENTDGSFSIVEPGYVPVFVWKWAATDPATGKTIMSTTKGREDKPVYNLRLLPIAPYMETPPAGMDDEQYARMRECWFETLEVLNNSSVIQVLSE